MSKRLLFYLFTLALLISSCSSAYKVVNLDYGKAQYGGDKISKIVYINKYDDNRDEELTSGENRIGLIGDDVVVSTQDISALMVNSLSSELASAGFDVRKVDAQKDMMKIGPEVAWIEGKVHKIFVDQFSNKYKILSVFKLTHSAEVVSNIHLELTVIYKGNKYTKDYKAMSTEKRGAYDDPADSYKNVLEDALRKLTIQAVNDIVSLVK